MLSVLDRKWREHLYEMDYLQEGIGLRAMAQRDPLVEYQREGFELFGAMMDAIKEESVGFIFNVEVQVEEEPAALDEAESHDVPVAAPLSAAPAAPAAEAPEPDAPADVAEPVPSAFGGRGLARPHLRAKGLEAPKPARLEYSAPTVDGEAGVTHLSDDGDGDGELEVVGDEAGRAERRRAQRAQRKRKR